MGISFYSCAACGCGFSDYSHDEYTRCEYCDAVFCSHKCANTQYRTDDPDEREEPECCLCRKINASDAVLLQFCLKKLNLTREQALAEWQKEPPASE
jgi:hypothetical protein